MRIQREDGAECGMTCGLSCQNKQYLFELRNDASYLKKPVSLRNVTVKSCRKYHKIIANGRRYSLILAVVYFMINT